MKALATISLSVLLGLARGNQSEESVPDYQVTYDYCSLSHSTHVLDRLDQEVFPIFAKYEVAINKERCPFSHERLG